MSFTARKTTSRSASHTYGKYITFGPANVSFFMSILYLTFSFFYFTFYVDGTEMHRRAQPTASATMRRDGKYSVCCCKFFFVYIINNAISSFLFHCIFHCLLRLQLHSEDNCFTNLKDIERKK